MPAGRVEVPKRLFVWICGQISNDRKWKWQEKKEMTGDEASKRSEEKTEFWAVATHFERLFSRPTPSTPGVATAQVVQQNSSLLRRQSCRRGSQKF